MKTKLQLVESMNKAWEYMLQNVVKESALMKHKKEVLEVEFNKVMAELSGYILTICPNVAEIFEKLNEDNYFGGARAFAKVMVFEVPTIELITEISIINGLKLEASTRELNLIRQISNRLESEVRSLMVLDLQLQRMDQLEPMVGKMVTNTWNKGILLEVGENRSTVEMIYIDEFDGTEKREIRQWNNKEIELVPEVKKAKKAKKAIKKGGLVVWFSGNDSEFKCVGFDNTTFLDEMCINIAKHDKNRLILVDGYYPPKRKSENIEKIVLTNCVDNDKLEECQTENIEVEKEIKNMNNKLIVKVMENRGVITTDVHFENPTSGKTLLGNNALVRKFKAEFGSKFHSYKNGMFYGTNLKGLGNEISVFADMNDCDFYQYLNNDCIVEPLVVDDELLNGIEAICEKRFEGLTLGENLELPGEPHKDMFEGSTSALEIIQEIKEEYKTVEAINSLTQEEKAECLEKVEKLMAQEVAPQVEAEPVAVAPIVETEVIVELNSEKKGIEIKFNAKPSAEQRTELKECGYRWHAKKELWYAKQTDETLALANKFAPVEAEPVAPKKEIKIEVNFNDAKKGIELKFNGVPSESVRTKLKDAGYRWYKGLGLWIAKQSNEEAMALAKKCLAPKNEKVVAEKVEEVAPIVEVEPVKNAFALIQEIKAEQEKVVVSEKKFNALQDRALNKKFISMQDIIDNKGKQGNYSNEYNVHSRFLNKILANPNFNVIEIDTQSYGFNITGIEGRYTTYNKNCYTSNKYIHEITQENTEAIKAEIFADIEASKENNWYEKKGYSMKIEGVYDLNKAYITLRTNRKVYKFVAPGYALDKFNEGVDGSVSDYRKINSIDEHIKDYNKFVKWLEIAVKEDLKFLATWLKHDIENELKCIENMKKIMSEKLEKVEEFKALQYSENLKIEA